MNPDIGNATNHILVAWLRKNPLAVISKPAFLDILQKTRSEVYTIDCIVGAWRKARCWPIDREPASKPTSTSGIPVDVSVDVSDNVRALDTPARLRVLSKRVEDIARLNLNHDDTNLVYELIDFVGEKLTKHRDIIPRADTLSKLRSGKVRKQIKRTSRHVGGEARVLTYKHVNDGIRKLAEDVAAKLKKQQISEEKRRITEQNKLLFEMRVNQWHIDLEYHKSVIIPEWEEQCAEVDATWAAAKKLGQRGKKPPYPTRPKKPLKPKKEDVLGDLSVMVRLVDIPEEEDNENDEEVDASDAGGEDEQDLIDSMRALEIGHFAEVSSHVQITPVFLYYKILF